MKNRRSRSGSEGPPSPSLFLPGKVLRSAAAPPTGFTLSPELQGQVARRLRWAAIAYSLAFFFADLFPSFFMGMSHARSAAIDWIPTVGSIAIGVAVAVVAGRPNISWQSLIHLGLIFEIVSSYGIALAQYFGEPLPPGQTLVYFVLSPSWVAIWMIVYSVVVPAPPGRALLALFASASAPPVLIGLALQREGLSHLFTPTMFFLHHVLPYLICVAMAYFCARVVYQLGTDVTRARDLGSYRLIERLGSGGMGEVWRASHQMLARPAAIKFIHPRATTGATAEESRTMFKRFELEAQTTASLSSSHTVELYDFGVTDGGTFYYVMELLDGLDCDLLVRRFGPLESARVVHLLIQICDSLEEAHDKGLIHRDVKPANVYVCRSGNQRDFVKVLDFGLVTHQRVPAAESLRLTLPEQAVGTPEFMAPEIALGHDIDGRTDLYGLGCVAYWLVTGRPVFEGAGYYEVISKHMQVPPDPPSRHAPEGVPEALEALILRCLEKAPERRPADARDVARELRSIPFSEPWNEERAHAWWAERLETASSPSA
jgi:eukaryotic-like serine/threonine-protein kinase